jgi:hypothetical protein
VEQQARVDAAEAEAVRQAIPCVLVPAEGQMLFDSRGVPIPGGCETSRSVEGFKPRDRSVVAASGISSPVR